MDEADKILIDLLIANGLDSKAGEIESFEDFTADSLLNAAGVCLETIYESKNQPQLFPKSFSSNNVAARYKIGQRIAQAISALGFNHEIGYQSFLYPNVKDTRKILSFLVEMLPKDQDQPISQSVNVKADNLDADIRLMFKQELSKPWLPHFCDKKSYNPRSITSPQFLFKFSRNSTNEINEKWSVNFPNIMNQFNDVAEFISAIYSYNLKQVIYDKIDHEELRCKLAKILENIESKETLTLQKAPSTKKRTKFLSQTEAPVEIDLEKNLQDVETKYEKVQEEYTENYEYYEAMLDKIERTTEFIEKLTEEDIKLAEEIEEKTKELSVKEKTGIVLNYGEESLDKLTSALEKKENQIEKIKQQWNDHKSDLEYRIKEREEENRQKYSKTLEIEEQLKFVKEGMVECQRDYQDKDIQIRQLNDKVLQILENEDMKGKQGRSDFTKRIFELTENKKKQDYEISRILGSIFQLQKEINLLRGKLERCFIETNDVIFASAKKDELCKLMYRVLIGLHENCRSLVEVIEERGKLFREIREVETSLDMENPEVVEKNLSRISEDFEQAKQKCEQLKSIIKQNKMK